MCEICKTLCICATFFSWCPPCPDTSLVSSGKQDGPKAAQQVLLRSDRCFQAPAAALHHGRSTNRQGNQLPLSQTTTFSHSRLMLSPVLFFLLCSYHKLTAETALVQAKRPPPPAPCLTPTCLWHDRGRRRTSKCIDTSLSLFSQFPAWVFSVSLLIFVHGSPFDRVFSCDFICLILKSHKSSPFRALCSAEFCGLCADCKRHRGFWSRPERTRSRLSKLKSPNLLKHPLYGIHALSLLILVSLFFAFPVVLNPQVHFPSQ